MKINSISFLTLFFITICLLACSSTNNKPTEEEGKQTEQQQTEQLQTEQEQTEPKQIEQTVQTVQKEKAIQKIEVIAKGDQCAIDKAKQLVIKDQAGLDKLWQESFKGVDMAPAKPVVNFTQKWVVAAFLGMVSNGGHTISINELKADAAGATTVIIKHNKPGQGCMSSMAIEFPFVIATISPLSTEKIAFKTIVEEKKCE